MTSKVYKTAQGKSVDLGTIMLQNEKTRAVGNMNVNARGDRLDSGNKVIETKNRQIQRQNNRTAVSAEVPLHASTNRAKRAKKASEQVKNEEIINREDQPELILDPAVVASPPSQEIPVAGGGLAAAIARSKLVKQEKEKTVRELAQSKPGVRKI